MKKFLIVLSVIIILPIVALIAAVYFVDINNYKPEIEKLVAKYAKVDAKINGDMKIGISLKPSIEIADVSVSDQETKNPIAQIGAALVQFSIKPLLAKEFVVDTVQTDNTKIYYSATDYAEINNLDVSMESYDSPINVDIDTDVSGTNIKAKGTISSLKKLMESNFSEVEADIVVNAMGYTVDYKGKITDLDKEMKATGNYKVEYKKNVINGDVYVSMANKIPYVKLSANSNNINIADFGEQQSASISGALVSKADASELIKNTPVPFDYLKMVNADVVLKIKQLIVNSDVKLTDIDSVITVKNGVLSVNFKNIGAGSGKISGMIDANAATKSAALNLKGNDIIIQQLYTPIASASNPSFYVKEGGKTNFLFNLKSSGNDTDHLISNASGQVILLADSSVMKISSLEKLRGNIIVQILDKLQLKIGNSDMNLKCAVMRGDVVGGRVTYPKGIVVDAKDFYLVADGTINLNNDKINLSLQPFSGNITDTNISSILGSLLKINGTFQNPKVGINEKQTATAVVGAIATAGMYNVGDMMLSADGSPCHTALKGTEYANYFPEVKGVRNTVSDQYNNTKDAVKNLGKNIKNLGTDTKDAVKNQLGGMLKGLTGN